MAPSGNPEEYVAAVLFSESSKVKISVSLAEKTSKEASYMQTTLSPQYLFKSRQILVSISKNILPSCWLEYRLTRSAAFRLKYSEQYPIACEEIKEDVEQLRLPILTGLPNSRTYTVLLERLHGKELPPHKLNFEVYFVTNKKDVLLHKISFEGKRENKKPKLIENKYVSFDLYDVGEVLDVEEWTERIEL